MKVELHVHIDKLNMGKHKCDAWQDNDVNENVDIDDNVDDGDDDNGNNDDTYNQKTKNRDKDH